MAGDRIKSVWLVFVSTIFFACSLLAVEQGIPAPAEPAKHAENILNTESTAGELGRVGAIGQIVQSPVSAEAVSAAAGATASGEKKDLTSFFLIGFIVNILLIGAFLFWAVGQWRKTKQE